MVKHISSSHKIYGLDLKLYTTPLSKTSVKTLADYLHSFMSHLKIEKANITW